MFALSQVHLTACLSSLRGHVQGHDKHIQEEHTGLLQALSHSKILEQTTK